MDIEDLNSEVQPIEHALQRDIGRIAENVHALQAEWRARIARGEDVAEGMNLAAEGLMGRFLRTKTAAAEDPAGFDKALENIAGDREQMTKADLDTQIDARVAVLEAFRDAPKGRPADQLAALDALTLDYPAPRQKPATTFIDRPLPAVARTVKG